MKFTGNNHYPLLMTWLDVGGQRARSHLGSDNMVAKASTSTLGHRDPSSS